MGMSAPAHCIFHPLFHAFIFLLLFKFTLLCEFYKYLCLHNPPHFIVPQGFGIAALCLLMNACTAGECVRPRCAHACTPLVREQCVMAPAERWCVKRCNVFVRRRCQHHGPLSWPGFLTQRFLSQLIGPDTNFLAKLQCGRYNLIADPHPAYTHTHKHAPPSNSVDYPTARHLNFRRPPVDIFFQHHFSLGNTHSQTVSSALSSFFREQVSRKDFLKHAAQVFPLALSNFNVLYVAKILLMLCSHPYFCLCIPISCSGKHVSVVGWLVTCGCINI